MLSKTVRGNCLGSSFLGSFFLDVLSGLKSENSRYFDILLTKIKTKQILL
jgi:hypothetical protein